MPDEYEGERWDVFCAFPANVKSILDVGCGSGQGFASFVEKGTRVVGVDIDEEAVSEARNRLSDAFVMDIERQEWPEKFIGSFDMVAFCDCLEHLADPWSALAKARALLSPDGVVVASIPNLRQIRILAKTVLGRWDYIRGPGTLQRDHLRFFTRRTVNLVFDEAGYEAPHFFFPTNTWHIKGLERRAHALTLNRFPDFWFGSYTVAARPKS